MDYPGYRELLNAAAHPDDPLTLALAGTIALAPARAAPYDVALAGVGAAALDALSRRHFPGLVTPLCGVSRTVQPNARVDEFDELLALLMRFRSVDGDDTCWLAHAVATACMAQNHLWQDLGLPDRRTLSGIMDTYFSTLAGRNTANMRWKKFFYRELCTAADISVCVSPSCEECNDYEQCFGAEEAGVSSCAACLPVITVAGVDVAAPRRR